MFFKRLNGKCQLTIKTERALALLLLLCGTHCFGGSADASEPIPTPSFSRNSIAYDNQGYEYSIDSPRMETVCFASTPAVEFFPDTSYHVPCDVDGNYALVVSPTKIYRTKDGVNFEQLADIQDSPFSSYRPTNNEVFRSIKKMEDGSYIVCMFVQVNGEPGHLFRSADQGQSWTHVHQLSINGITSFGWCAVRDNEAAVGEYGAKTDVDDANGPRRIYYTNDYGATWHLIHNPDDIATQHCHTLCFAPDTTDTIYLCYGDLPSSRIDKLDYDGTGSKTDSGNWTVTSTICPGVNPVSAYPDERYVYFGHDGASKDATLYRYDPCTGDFERCFNLPHYSPDGANKPYIGNYGKLDVYSVTQIDGVYYATGMHTSIGADSKYAGIYVSADGQNWICAYREENIKGFFRIAGKANGYIWCSYQLYGVKKLCRFTPVEVKNITPYRVEKGITNQATENLSSIETDLSGWTAYWDSTCQRSNEQSLYGSYSLKVTGEDNSVGFGMIFSSYLPKPELNQYMILSCWIYLADSWPSNYGFYAQIDTSAADAAYIDKHDNTSYLSMQQRDGWYKLIFWAKSLAPSSAWNDGPRLRILIKDRDQGNFSDAVFYLDGLQMVYLDDMHFSGSWTLGGTSRADENLSYLVNLPAQSTIYFSWWPQCSSREWHNDCPIANISDGSNYINLYWQENTGKFVATDGINTASTSVKSWEFIDLIKFAFTNLNGDFRLSVQSSKGGTEHALTDNTATLLGPPSELTFSTNNVKNSYGVGLYGDLKFFNTPLSTEDIEGVFEGKNLPFALDLCNHWLTDKQYDLNNDGIVNFIDFALICASQR